MVLKIWLQEGDTMRCLVSVPPDKFAQVVNGVKTLVQSGPSAVAAIPVLPGKRNARPVEATDIDEARYRRYLDKGAKPVTDPVFPTARAASIHIGLQPTAVSQALCLAKAKGKKEVTIRGVTFAYADELHD